MCRCCESHLEITIELKDRLGEGTVMVAMMVVVVVMVMVVVVVVVVVL